MEQVLMFATILAPVITALVELVKKTQKIPKKYIPFISFLIGILIGIVGYPFTDLGLTMRIWSGGLAGLASTGLFELVKKKNKVAK
ncbi:Bacteriophage A118-like holin, Hol118 [Salinibacillus kushneri]|uniref:Bacteriophage A118-like holin, Hol118 n=1 Tax=Salinibacillus kushneri TaxID=237682 RepID=A0A1I0B7L7_9BACI|nr:holin [Salinibacillus kushneri]SET02770.1 Bacteriophage A118-like holin, Hol118 [Salinibacillus kushneri]SEU04077.1 Bacteriophage A118-like holin, Hol118 [Salinibacillus kushneri]